MDRAGRRRRCLSESDLAKITSVSHPLEKNFKAVLQRYADLVVAQSVTLDANKKLMRQVMVLGGLFRVVKNQSDQLQSTVQEVVRLL